MSDDKDILNELREITKDRETWESKIVDVAAILDESDSTEVKAKALWLLGEMGLRHPVRIAPYVGCIASFLKSDMPKLRERSANAIGRIGRADRDLVIGHMDSLIRLADDESGNVRHAFVWACENIAANAPELFCERLDIFYHMIFDSYGKVRIEAPEMFRVIGKSRPECVKPYLERLERIAEEDSHPVVRIHAAGAVRMTGKSMGKD